MRGYFCAVAVMKAGVWQPRIQAGCTAYHPLDSLCLLPFSKGSTIILGVQNMRTFYSVLYSWGNVSAGSNDAFSSLWLDILI